MEKAEQQYNLQKLIVIEVEPEAKSTRFTYHKKKAFTIFGKEITIQKESVKGFMTEYSVEEFKALGKAYHIRPIYYNGVLVTNVYRKPYCRLHFPNDYTKTYHFNSFDTAKSKAEVVKKEAVLAGAKFIK